MITVKATRDEKGRFFKGCAGIRFKGGSVSWNGYRLIHVNRRQVREHRKVWEAAHGPLPEGAILHHKNGDKLDNRLENLEITTRQEHPRTHFKHPAPPCSICGVPSQALKLCNRHYKQLKKYGCIPDPLPAMNWPGGRGVTGFGAPGG